MLHILCAASALFLFTLSDLHAAEQNKKLKITILTSSGGRGHTSATEALHAYLDADYTVQEVNLLKDILGEMDVIKSFGSQLQSVFPANVLLQDLAVGGAESLYNYALTTGQTGILTVINQVGPVAMELQQEKALQLITQYFTREKPQCVISVIPVYNYLTAQALSALQIPFWIIPTDFDATMAVHNLDLYTDKQCFVNLFVKDALIEKHVKTGFSNVNHYTYVGMPVRPQFLRDYSDSEKAFIRNKYEITPDEMVIMVMFGGRGTEELLTVAQELAKVKGPVHFLFCIGKAEELHIPLESLVRSKKMHATIIGFTSEIAEIMAISDLLVTKSGGQTVSEALYMKLPMVLDARSEALPWEEFNRTFVKVRALGITVNNLNQYASIVQKIVNNPELLKQWRHNIMLLHLPNSRDAIRAELKRILR